MRVLLTGAAGFIGGHVAKRLTARGDEVLGLDNFNDYYDPAIKRDHVSEVLDSAEGHFRCLDLDFSDNGALSAALKGEKFDRVIHLGAQAGVRYSIENPATYIQSNLVGHANILELARHRECEHLVYASSSSVYGGNTKLPFSVEDRCDHPVSLYAATKRADEMLSESYAHLYRLPQTGLRFFTVYGAWGRPDMMMWNFTKKILAGEPIPVFNHGDMYRDFTYIEDIVSGVVACLDNPPADDGAPKAGGSTKPHALYNIGNHRSEHLMKVIELLEAECGRKADKQMLDMQPGDVQRTYADIDAIQQDLGYQPTTPVEVGVPKFVRWYKEYHGL